MIEFEGSKYDSIEKFDCHVLSFDFDAGGGYCTVLPISPTEFREKHPTGASVAVKIADAKTTFTITSDHGDIYTVIIDNEHGEDIMTAIGCAFEQKLITGQGNDNAISRPAANSI